MAGSYSQCPCGRIPTRLCLTEASSSKYAFVCGDCCGEWFIEFNTQYQKLTAEGCKSLGTEAWEAASRSAT